MVLTGPLTMPFTTLWSASRRVIVEAMMLLKVCTGRSVCDDACGSVRVCSGRSAAPQPFLSLPDCLFRQLPG